MHRLNLHEVLSCPALPTLPTIAVELLSLTTDQSAHVKDIAACVQHDPALTAKILRTVNSSYYGLVKPCPTIARAITYLGLKTVRSVVLSFSLVDVSRQIEEGFDLVVFWRRSLYAAAAARRIAAAAGRCDADEAYTAALMQDIGMFALHAAEPSLYRYLVLQCNLDHGRLCSLERNIFQLDHAHVGAALAEKWRLPPEMIEAIRHHHDHRQTQQHDLVCTVALGYEVAAAIVTESTARLDQLAFQWFGFTGQETAELVDAAGEDAHELSRLLDVKICDSAVTARLIAEAEEAFLCNQAAGAETPSPTTPSPDDADASMADHVDPLTGLGDRRAFGEKLTVEYAAAVKKEKPFGIVLVDPDGVRTLIESRGRETADAVLVELASRLGAAKRGRDILFRLGGAQFGLILPGTPAADLAAIGDRLRSTVAERAFAPPPGAAMNTPITISVWIGAAAYEPEDPSGFESPQAVLSAADVALMAAKQAGANEVRLYTPTRKRATA